MKACTGACLSKSGYVCNVGPKAGIFWFFTAEVEIAGIELHRKYKQGPVVGLLGVCSDQRWAIMISAVVLTVIVRLACSQALEADVLRRFQGGACEYHACDYKGWLAVGKTEWKFWSRLTSWSG